MKEKMIKFFLKNFLNKIKNFYRNKKILQRFFNFNKTSNILKNLKSTRKNIKNK